MADHVKDVLYVKELISSCLYMNLSTSDKNHQPWSTPLHFVVDENYNFYWYSMRAALHSQNIYANEKAAVSIYDPAKDNTAGVYMRGTAFEIPEADLSRVMKLYAAQHYPGDTDVRDEFLRMTEDFMDKSALRFYVFSPQQIWVSDREEFRNNKWLDQRKELKMPL